MADVPAVRLDEGVLPAYAHTGDAGADLIANVDVVLAARGGRALIPTGVSVAIPDGYAGLVLARSGLAVHHGVACLNAPGLIDSGFRGELQVVLINTDSETDYVVRRGDRIAQLVIVPIATGRFVESEELPASTRGEGGFGHSGR